LLRKSLGVNVCVGASNVSYGLPDRPALNQAFLALCIQAGATCAITDPGKLGQTVRAVDLLLGRDSNSLRYLRYFRSAEKLREDDSKVNKQSDSKIP
jgi:5-methyltetrahydrofolate--homocysteine methyltransferase